MRTLPCFLLYTSAWLAFAGPAISQGINVPGVNDRPPLYKAPPVLSYRPPKLVLEPPRIRQPVVEEDCAAWQRDRTRSCVREAPRRAESREEGRGSVRQPGR